MVIHVSKNTKPDGLKPEFVRVPEAVRLFGICRSSLYELISEGKVKSTCLKSKRGNTRGVRLISYDSLKAYIESQFTTEGAA